MKSDRSKRVEQMPDLRNETQPLQQLLHLLAREVVRLLRTEQTRKKEPESKESLR
jgi:hypothetical protein